MFKFKKLEKYLLILFLFHPLIGLCQYSGGSNDGVATFQHAKMNITDDNAFKGGNNDGFVNINLVRTNITDVAGFKGSVNDGFAIVHLSKTNITDPAAFKGGNDDGVATTTLMRTNITDLTVFKGGANDGFTAITFSKMNITDATAFKGGNDDGVATFLLPKLNFADIIAFKGGIGRGETQFKVVPFSCDGTTFTWNGSTSTAWENPNNWDCGTLPNTGSIVIIPFGVPNYPKVNANFEIKKLFVNANASIVIMPGVQFKLNGQ